MEVRYLQKQRKIVPVTFINNIYLRGTLRVREHPIRVRMHRN